MAQYIALVGAAMSILAPSKKNDNVGGVGSSGRIGVHASLGTTSFSSGMGKFKVTKDNDGNYPCWISIYLKSYSIELYIPMLIK